MESNLTRGCNRLQVDIGAFYDSLSKQQIRDLKVLIESTDFRFDIVANLPIELILLVFQHLELYQLFQCRRVSRRWLELLGADGVVRPMLQPWNATEDVKLRIPEGSSSKAVLDIYAEHQDAFQTGNAFGRFQMPHGQDISYSSDRSIHAYSDGLLAWVSLTGRSDPIHLRDLESGEERTFMSPERDKIEEIALSQTLLVAMTSSARCYIWAHQTPRPPFVLRTLSRARNVFHLSKASFILIQRTPNFPGALACQSIPVITWKLRECWRLQPPEQPPQAIVSQFSIQALSGSFVGGCYRVQVERQEQQIVLLESTKIEKKRGHTLRILHLDFEGETLFEESLDCSFAIDVSFKAHENHPLQKERFFDIWVMTYNLVHHDLDKSSRKEVQAIGITYLRYYLDRRLFRVLERKNLPHSVIPPGAWMAFLPWKGIAYFEGPRDHFSEGFQRHLMVTDAREETCVEARYVAPQGSGGSGSLDRDTLFLGDEVFLVKVTSKDLIVWCFDKHRRMAGEDEKFRQERRSSQRKRLTNPTHRRCEF